MKKKTLLSEVRKMQKIAGLLREEEDIDLSNTPQFKKGPKVPWGWEVEFFDKEFDSNDPTRLMIVFLAGNHPDGEELNVAVYEETPGEYFIRDWNGYVTRDSEIVYNNFDDAVKAAINKAEELYDEIATDWYPDSEGDLV